MEKEEGVLGGKERNEERRDLGGCVEADFPTCPIKPRREGSRGTAGEKREEIYVNVKRNGHAFRNGRLSK